eukprot:evm.model.scf_2127.2 EVM.evm.TU.scf_2127.2   scf_2127:16786-26112(+)
MFLTRLYDRLLGRPEGEGPSEAGTSDARPQGRDGLLDLEEGGPDLSDWSYTGGGWGRDAELPGGVQPPGELGEGARVWPFDRGDGFGSGGGQRSPKQGGCARRGGKGSWEVVAFGGEGGAGQLTPRGGGGQMRGNGEVVGGFAGEGVGNDVERACESPDSCIVHSDGSEWEEDEAVHVGVPKFLKAGGRDVLSGLDAQEGMLGRGRSLGGDDEVRSMVESATAGTSVAASNRLNCKSKSQRKILFLSHSGAQQGGRESGMDSVGRPGPAATHLRRLSGGVQPADKSSAVRAPAPPTPFMATSAPLHPDPIEPPHRAEPSCGSARSSLGCRGPQEALEACTVVDFMQPNPLTQSVPNVWRNARPDPPPIGRHGRQHSLGGDLGVMGRDSPLDSTMLVRQSSLPTPKSDDTDSQLPGWLSAGQGIPEAIDRSVVQLIPATQGPSCHQADRLEDGACTPFTLVKTPRGAPRPLPRTPRGAPAIRGRLSWDQGSRLCCSKSLSETTSGSFYSSLDMQRYLPGLEAQVATASGQDRKEDREGMGNDKTAAHAGQSQDRPQSAVPSFSRPWPEGFLSPRQANLAKRLVVNGPRVASLLTQEESSTELGPQGGKAGRVEPQAPVAVANLPSLRLDLLGGAAANRRTEAGTLSGRGGRSTLPEATANRTPKREQVSAFKTCIGATPFDDAASDSTDGGEEISAWGGLGVNGDRATSPGNLGEDGDKRSGPPCLMSRHLSIKAVPPSGVLSMDDDSLHFSLEDPPDKGSREAVGRGRKGVRGPSHSVDYPAHFTPVTYQTGADE